MKNYPTKLELLKEQKFKLNYNFFSNLNKFRKT